MLVLLILNGGHSLYSYFSYKRKCVSNPRRMTVVFVYFVLLEGVGSGSSVLFHVRNDRFYNRGAEFAAGRVFGKIFLVWILA